MKRFPALAVALGAALALAACGDVIFNADFEADTSGARPSDTPAGPPTGDMIRVWIADPGNLVVTDSGINGKSLLYRYNPTLSQVDFIGRETGRDAPEYWAAWNGRAEGFSSATPRKLSPLETSTPGGRAWKSSTANSSPPTPCWAMSF